MGWERKRGKLEEFNRLLRGATDTSFTVQVGRLDILPSVRYCLTLDSDTRLPRDAARELIGIAEHPHEPARLRPPRGPGHRGLRRAAAARERHAGERRRLAVRADLCRPHRASTRTPRPCRTCIRISSAKGIYTGKGLYDVDAFQRALEGQVPENALLSHDLFEGLYARTGARHRRRGRGRLPVERARARAAPASLGSRRLADPLVAAARGADEGGPRRNPLPLIARWKILDNLRRSLMAPALVVLLAADGLVLPGDVRVWTIAGLVPMLLPILLRLATGHGGPPRDRASRVFLRSLDDDVAVRRRPGVTAAGVPRASVVPDGARRRASRSSGSFVTRRRLLEWETAAVAERGVVLEPRVFARQMIASPAVAAAAGAPHHGSAQPPRAVGCAAPDSGALGARPVDRVRPEPARPNSPKARWSPKIAPFSWRSPAHTWSYFATFTTADDHWLPPDNVQMRAEA